MKPKPFVRETDYGLYLSRELDQVLKFLNQHYTAADLAAACNVKLTHNFRRFINVRAEYGLIERHFAHNEAGRIVALYSRKGSRAP